MIPPLVMPPGAPHIRAMPRTNTTSCQFILAGFVAAIFAVVPAHAKILWSDPGARVVHETGIGVDILGGKVKRDDKISDTLYFKFHVDPISDVDSEPYFAGFQFFENGQERLGVGNALEAWGYSAFNTAQTGLSNHVAGEFNFNSAHPEPANLGLFWPYELVRKGHERTIVFKVQYVPGGDDLVTVWLDPDLGRGSSEKNQPENITTKFRAKAAFDEIRLRHDRGDKNRDAGNGWNFSDMAIATSFDDFVTVRFWQTWWFISVAAMAVLVGVSTTVRGVEKRKYRLQLQRAEQASALERERARIAQDLHDDLGSSLTRISLLSGLLRADRHNPGLVETHADKLIQSANQTVRALEEIVWAVRPRSDSLQSLVDYIAHFANELFEGTNTRCRLDLPHDLPARPLPPEVRHNIFLIVKEALTNALKHAAARQVIVQAKVTSDVLEILVLDDGKGLAEPAPQVEGKRHGLENMRRRAESIGGAVSWQSSPDGGTSIQFTVLLPERRGAG
jgi:signal transduction histidine kinase